MEADHPEGMEAAGRGGLELSRQMAAQREVFERQIAEAKELLASATAAYNAVVLSVRLHSQNNISRREELDQITGEFDDQLDAEFAKLLFVKASKDAEFRLIKELVSRAVAKNAQLKKFLTDLMNKRDQYDTFVSNQREAVEDLEAKMEQLKCNMEQ